MRADWPDIEDVLLIDALGSMASLSPAVDAGKLFARAEAHGLLGVVYDAWKAAGRPVAPNLERSLQTLVIARELDHHAHVAMLARVDTAFDEARLVAVALKGALLGARLYARPSARATTDIDLLIAEKDLACASAVLSSLGYVGRVGPAEERFRREHHHLHFNHPHAPLLELHFHAYRGFGRILRSEPLLERASLMSSAWKTVRVLDASDELVFLGVHAAAHRFLRLGWLFDMKLLFERMSDSERQLAFDRADAAGYGPAFAFALDRVREVFRVPTPRRKTSVWRGPLARRIMPEPMQPVLRSATRFFYTSMLCDSSSSVLSYASIASVGYVKRICGMDA